MLRNKIDRVIHLPDVSYIEHSKKRREKKEELKESLHRQKEPRR